MDTRVVVTLIGKAQCHLCDDARAAIERVLAGPTYAASPERVQLVEKSILDDPVLASRYGEEIPVVLINDVQHCYWKVDGPRFEAALNKALRRRRWGLGKGK